MAKMETTYRKRLKPLFRHWDDQVIATQLIRLMVLYEDLRLEYNSFYERNVAYIDDLQSALIGACISSGEAGLRCDEVMALEWTDVDPEQTATLCRTIGLEGRRHGAGRWAVAICAADQTVDRSPTAGAAFAGSTRPQQ